MAQNFIPKIEYGAGPTTIEFEYPPEGSDPFGEDIKTKAQVGEAARGNFQTSFLANITTYDVTFAFVKGSLTDSFKTFYTDHASRGLEFKYFFDKDLASFITVVLDKSARRFKPEATHFNSADDDYKYEFDLKMRIKI